MNAMKPSNLTMQVYELAKEAGKLMQERPQEIESKGGNSNWVTDRDKIIQDFLMEKLGCLLPGSAFLGEESEAWDIAGGEIWIVDPIDGTANFIRDLGASVVSIALMKNQTLELGVVYNPFRNEMFYAEKGCGAYLNG